MSDRNQADASGMKFVSTDFSEILAAIDSGMVLPAVWDELLTAIEAYGALTLRESDDPAQRREALRMVQRIPIVRRLIEQNNRNANCGIFDLGMRFTRMQLLALNSAVKESQRAGARRNTANVNKATEKQIRHDRIRAALKSRYRNLQARGQSHHEICTALARSTLAEGTGLTTLKRIMTPENTTGDARLKKVRK